jgi:hypothetical protein
MKLSTVKLEELSSLTHEVKLPETEKFHTPAFKVISYHGEYGYGAGGKNDALYICATATAAHKAWYTEGIIIDFSDLKYEWGDEMEWVFGIAQGGSTKCTFPVVVLVGDRSKQAIQTLIPGEYAELCAETFADAVALIERKRNEYKRCLAAWRSGAAQKVEQS